MKVRSGILTSLLIILSISLSYGQCEKGSVLLGGQTNLSILSLTTSVKANSVSSNFDKNTSFTFSPVFGYFFSKNLLIGIMTPLTVSSTREIASDNIYKAFSMQFIPLIQKYFGNKKVRPFIFVAGGLGWGNSKSSSQLNSIIYTNKYKLYTLKPGGGVSFFFNERISFDCSLGYSYDIDSVNSTSPGYNNSVHSVIQKGFKSEIGINFYL